MTQDELIAGLPGEALVRDGRRDLAAGRASIAAHLIAIGQTRLSRAGLTRIPTVPASQDAELALYRALRTEGGDAYARYNALVRELVSFELALEQRVRRGI
jgi:hypothetical protein